MRTEKSRSLERARASLNSHDTSDHSLLPAFLGDKPQNRAKSPKEEMVRPEKWRAPPEGSKGEAHPISQGGALRRRNVPQSRITPAA